MLVIISEDLVSPLTLTEANQRCSFLGFATRGATDRVAILGLVLVTDEFITIRARFPSFLRLSVHRLGSLPRSSSTRQSCCGFTW